jgi:hypothetical protein
MVSYDRVALVAIVGNEDGAHHVSAEMFQGLNDVGFTIPANGVTYWVGEAMHKSDYTDLDETSRRAPRRRRWPRARPCTWPGSSPRAQPRSVQEAPQVDLRRISKGTSTDREMVTAG